MPSGTPPGLFDANRPMKRHTAIQMRMGLWISVLRALRLTVLLRMMSLSLDFSSQGLASSGFSQSGPLPEPSSQKDCSQSGPLPEPTSENAFAAAEEFNSQDSSQSGPLPELPSSQKDFSSQSLAAEALELCLQIDALPCSPARDEIREQLCCQYPAEWQQHLRNKWLAQAPLTESQNMKRSKPRRTKRH